MILSILVIALVGAIAFFHYIQGFFSATLSAILTVFCAVFAVAYHEVLVDSIGQGQYADQAHAIALVVLFAGPYVLLRVIFDKFIPGNVQMAAIVDKIGAGAMGFVAGCFGVGVLILAAQTLPLRPSIAMHSLYEMNGQRNVVLPGGAGRRNQDAAVFDELKSDTFADEDRSSLILPVDTWLISLASHLSSGSLSGPVQFSDVHPDYQTELFGQRIGIQPGAKHTALGCSPSTA
jgi:uncharacterized membrane protein required for colicin V production